MHAAVSVASTLSYRDRQPYLIRGTHALDCLKQQVEIEAELHFDDREPQPFAIVDCHRVEAVHFALHAKARRLQEALHSGIE